MTQPDHEEVYLNPADKWGNRIGLAVIIAMLLYVGSTVSDIKGRNDVQDNQISTQNHQITQLTTSVSALKDIVNNSVQSFVSERDLQAAIANTKEVMLLRIEEHARRINRIEIKTQTASHSGAL